MSGLQISDLHKSFATNPVLTGLDLEVPAGSLTAILGSSGSGKTTLLRLLAGFETPDRGTVTIGARVVDAEGAHANPEQRKIGYVPQEGGLFPHLTVQANVAFGLPRAKRRHGVGELLEMVGLTGLERRYPHQLSGGQQQRVALARALAVKPEVVLLDEPFASLDANLRASVREQVCGILRESSTTTLLVTHDQDEALSLADQVAVLRDGKIVQHTTPQELYARPVDGDLACFVGDANILGGRIDGALVDTPLGKLPAHWHGEPLPGPCAVSVLIRPEQIEVRPVSADGSHLAGGDASATGRIARADYHGHDAVLQVQLGHEQSGLLVRVRTPGDARLSPGMSVRLDVRGPVLVWPATTDGRRQSTSSVADFEPIGNVYG